MSDLAVAEAGPSDAADVVDVIHRSFAARPVLDPPATAMNETVDSVARTLETLGGLLCRVDGQPAGALLFGGDETAAMRLRRVSAVPEYQSRGVASAMVGVAEEVASRRGFDDVVLEVRLELPMTMEFWYRRGYREVRRDGTRLTYGKAIPVTVSAPDPEATRVVGQRLGRLTKTGDLLVLSGELGAGKTTLVQGLASGLGVRGPVTSPTFVLSRVHPTLVGGPDLVHVDAYRLGGSAELDDMDLDASLESAVTAVEWGEGVAEGLADDRLMIRISRPRGDDPGLVDRSAGGTANPDQLGRDEARRITVVPVGASWLGRGLRSGLADPARE